MSEEKTWVESQLANTSDDKGKFKLNWNLKCKLYGDKVVGWIFIAIFAIFTPTLAYYLIVNLGTYTYLDTFTCLVNESFRVPCGSANITSDDCTRIKCCFDRIDRLCYHYLPSRYSYDYDGREYVASSQTTPFGTNATEKMEISVNEINSDQVAIILHEEKSSVYSNTLKGQKNYVVKKVKEKLMVEIHRHGTDELLLSTTKGPLIASDNYWEWTLYLTNHSLFGLNQTLITLKHDSNFSTVLYKNKNNHHFLPKFWAYSGGKFHGVVIKHDGPLEIKILPSYLVVLRSLTGGSIELELSLGPTPKQLHDQQMRVTKLPPYWMLGIHICRKTNELNVTKIIEQFSMDDEAQSYCIDENLLMALMDDELNNINILNETLTKLNGQGKKFLLSVPPQLPSNSTLYKSAKKLDLLYQYNNSDYEGLYLKQKVVYPDYSHTNIQDYLNELNNFINKYITINIDGFLLNDNWPVEESFKIWENVSFPYFPNIFREAMSYTIPWNATSEGILHIAKHNSYGPLQLEAFEKYYNNNNNTAHSDILLLSATKTDVQTQPSIIENVESSWDHLKQYLDNVLFDSISGNHLVSLPVCGDSSSFNNSFHETLCIRWYIVASTMPLFRISSEKPWREPANLETKYAELAAKEAINIRKSLLPYYYTILSLNEPVIRPMFYDFYENTTTFSMKDQYMIGDAILVSQPFTVNKQRLRIYLPSRVSVWYELWGGAMYTTNRTHSWVEIDLRETDFVAFVAQGTIVPFLDDNTINVIIAMNCTNHTCHANGTLLLDSYVNFEADESAITITNMAIENCNYTLGYVKLYHYDNATSSYDYYAKNESLCDGTTSVVYYNESNSSSMFLSNTI